MPRDILFASSNLHKVDEMRQLLPVNYHLIGLKDIQWNEEIPEPYFTFEENAKAKTDYVFQRTGISCFSDDSGLVIDALDGRPGVFSARYAGASGDHVENIKKVLSELRGQQHRSARFYSIIAYADLNGSTNFFKGIVEGTIAYEPAGHGGFGYDSIFIPQGFDKTFGQLSSIIKNRISHRSKALTKFIDYLGSH